MNIQQFIDVLATGSGASYSLSQGQQPTAGTMVSIYGHEFIPELPASFVRYKAELQREMIANAVHDFVVTNGLLLDDIDNYIGGWWSEGKLVLDVSKQFDDLREAVEFGIHNRQKAVYSIDLGKDIDLPAPQDAGTETQRATYARLAAQAIANDAIYSIA
jgi:hypothetical protein